MARRGGTPCSAVSAVAYAWPLLLLASAVLNCVSGQRTVSDGVCCRTNSVTSTCDPSPNLSGIFVWDFPTSGQGYTDYTNAQSACTAAGGTPILGTYCLGITLPDAVGDPHITGFDGSSYLLWGKPNATYNLLSERSHHINIRLYHPPGRADAHALYINAVGIMINGARLRVHLVAPPAAAADKKASMALWIEGVEQPVSWAGHPIAARAVDATTAYAIKAPDHMEITSADISLTVRLEDNDHLDVHVDEVAAYWGDVHGVMGQTHKAAFRLKYNYAKGKAVGDLPTTDRQQEAAASKKKLHLQGEEDDYVTTGLLKADDKFSRFASATAEPAAVTAVVTRRLLQATPQRAEHNERGLHHGLNVMDVGRARSVAGVVADSATDVVQSGQLHGGSRRRLLATIYTCTS